MTPPVLPPPLPRSPRPRRRWPVIAAIVALIALVVMANVALIAWATQKQKQRKAQQARWQQQRSPRFDQDFPPGVVPEGTPRRPSKSRTVVAPAPKPKVKPSGPRAAIPELSVAGGVFTEPFRVEIKARSKSANTVIRYTLNGMEPTETSAAYSGPISVSGTALLQARAFEPGIHPSATASAAYTFLDETLRQFSSTLPLVILNAHGQGVSSEQYITGSARFIRPENGRATLTGPADYDGRGDLKRRGFSSLRLPKASFTFKGRDEDGDKAKAAIFGMPSESDWVLYAPYSDKTLMRDVLAYEMAGLMGRYAPRTRFVEVFVKRGSGRLTMSEYAGVYVLVERIKRDKQRVNIAKLTPEDNAEPAITGGYIIKRDHWDSPWGGGWGTRNASAPAANGDIGFSTSRRMRLFYVEPDERDLTPQQKAWIGGYMNSLERAIYGGNFASPTEGYAKYLDVDSFIDHHWLVEATKNIDGFRYSCYMVKDRGGKLKIEPPWDWNLSFGNADYHEAWLTGDWYYPLLRTSEVCWFSRLDQDPEFHQRHIDRWAELRTNALDPARFSRRVDELAAQLKEAQARNFRRWPIIGEHIRPNHFIGDTWQEELDYLKKWFRARVAWIDRQFPAVPTIANKDNPAPSGGPISLQVRRGEIYYTLDGTDPRAIGGNVAAQAKRYEAPVSLSRKSQLVARARDGGNWSAPLRLNPR